MTDFTALVSSEEWKPLVEAGSRAICHWQGLDPDEFAPAFVMCGLDNAAVRWWEVFAADAKIPIAAFLTAAVEKKVIKEVYFGMQPALVFAIIKTGEK